DITKTGTTVSYSGFLNGNPIWTGGSGNVHSYTLSDGAGMNTIEIAGQYTGGPTQSYDNIKVTAIIAQSAANIVANPASPGALNMGLVAVSTISAPQTVTLSNLGDLPGTVTSATLSGPFSFSGTVPGGTIAGHADSVYNVVLDPQTVPTNVPRGTPYTGTATFVTSSGTFTYDLTADVYAHAGDVNGDGQVSLLDYNVVKANFGNAYESGNHWGDGDVNGDLQVGLLDFNIVKAHFGHTTGDGAAVTAVPEPATMSLLALAGLAALRRKR
ncbi:MAG: dockerin type I domain-containing protein, partial [Planctomycetota bacterium]|nr:dockerin type I domain-containing protein [Planctomycetota bacterium]